MTISTTNTLTTVICAVSMYYLKDWKRLIHMTTCVKHVLRHIVRDVRYVAHASSHQVE